MDVGNAEKCSHYDTVISDGYHVCTGCGLCVEDLVLSGIDTPLRNGLDYANGKAADKPKVENGGEVKNEDLTALLDLCSNANLPSRYAHQAYQVFDKIKQNLSGKKPRSFKPLLFAGFYYILQEEKSSFTLREMTGLCGIPANVIASAFNKYVKKSVQLAPSQLAPRFCAKLLMPKDIQKGVQTTLEHYERLTDCALNPACVVAGVIYWHVKKHKLPLKLKTICSTCGVSPVSVSRFIKRFT